MPNIPKDIWRALKEIMPSDRFEVKKVKKKGDIYEVDAEDKEYKYKIEISLSPRGDEYQYSLLDFSYEEKRRTHK